MGKMKMSQTKMKTLFLVVLFTSVTSKEDPQKGNSQLNETVKNKMLEKNLEKLTSDMDLLLREVSFLKNPPHYHICVYKHATNVNARMVSFDRVFYFDCNLCDDDDYNVHANFNLDDGVYTNGWPGTYTVTWDVRASNGYQGSKTIIIYLRKNGIDIPESEIFTYYSGPSGRAYDQGGRTMILRLNKGDTLGLYCQSCEGNISYITFCITLNTF